MLKSKFVYLALALIGFGVAGCGLGNDSQLPRVAVTCGQTAGTQQGFWGQPWGQGVGVGTVSCLGFQQQQQTQNQVTTITASAAFVNNLSGGCNNWFISRTSESARGTTAMQCINGACSGTILNWTDFGNQRVENVPRQNYLLCGFVDSNGDGFVTQGEPTGQMSVDLQNNTDSRNQTFQLNMNSTFVGNGYAF